MRECTNLAATGGIKGEKKEEGVFSLKLSSKHLTSDDRDARGDGAYGENDDRDGCDESDGGDCDESGVCGDDGSGVCGGDGVCVFI